MREEGVIALVVASPAGRADLIVDGRLPLATLLPPLLAASGATGTDNRRWQFWDGRRRLDSSHTLLEQGVLAGTEICLLPGS